jgi:hypothetical protein
LWVCSTLTALVATGPPPGRPDEGRHLVHVHRTAGHGAALDAAVLGGPAVLVRHDVRVGVADQLLGGRDDQAQADLVAHGAARHEHRGLVAEQARDLLLERVDRRVLAVDVVPDLGRRHRGPHPSVGRVSVSLRRSTRPCALG